MDASASRGASLHRHFVPETKDIHTVRRSLARLGLPTELVLQILDYARYWTELTTENIEHHVLSDEEWALHFTAAYPYLWVPTYLGPQNHGEQPKIREIEFIIVSHDQGWTTEGTRGTYETSSWFEVSRVSLGPRTILQPDLPDSTFCNVEHARKVLADYEPLGTWIIGARPNLDMEPQRMHCKATRKLTWPPTYNGPKPEMEEGRHAWYLQGNQVARGTSIFEGEMVKRYRVVWGCTANPRWEGNEGAGRGEDFIDELQQGDWFVIWARAKVSSQFNELMEKKIADEGVLAKRLGEPYLWSACNCTLHHLAARPISYTCRGHVPRNGSKSSGVLAVGTGRPSRSLTLIDRNYHA